MFDKAIHDSTRSVLILATLAGLALQGCAPAEGPLETLDAPVGVPAGVHLLWGDIHAHSDISADAPDSIPPMDMYAFMRDEADLDFGAVTDHDADLGSFRWKAAKTATNAMNCETPMDAAACPGGRHFVTLLGYEWTSREYGHRQVLLYQDSGRPWQSTYETGGNSSIPMYGANSPSTDNPCDLWGAYDALMDGTVPNLDLLTVAHHPAQHDGLPARIDWSKAPQLCPTPYPASYQPLVEVFSRHGNSEFDGMAFPEDDPVGCREAEGEGATVREALAMVAPDGEPLHRMGIVGSGDSHDGRPGLDGDGEARLDLCPTQPLDEDGQELQETAYRIEQTGLVAAYVRAPSAERALARSKVFGALRDRFTYGTTGARIGLWFEVGTTTADGGTRWSRMGEETEIDPDAGEGAVARIHVEEDDRPLERVSLLWLDPTLGGWEVCREWTDPPSPLDVMADLAADCSAGGWNAYYVKVEQHAAADASPLPDQVPDWIEREMAWSSPIWLHVD